MGAAVAASPARFHRLRCEEGAETCIVLVNMYMYMYVCMHIYMYIFIHIYIYIYVYIYTYVRVYMCLDAYLLIYTRKLCAAVDACPERFC